MPRHAPHGVAAALLLLLSSGDVFSQNDDFSPWEVDESIVVYSGRPLPPPGTAWKAPIGSSGDWFDATLWTAGMPTAGLPAFFVNGSETRIDGGAAEAASLSFIDFSAGRSVLTQAGGSLLVGDRVAIFDGLYAMAGGRLAAPRLSLSTLEVFLFSPDLSGVPRPEPSAPCDSLACPTGPAMFEAEARFDLSGGLVELAQVATIGRGRLTVSGGELRSPEIRIDSFRLIDSSMPRLSPASGVVSQSGGLVDVGGDVKIQDGAYQLSGGRLVVDRLLMGDPAMVGNLFASARRSPEFVQTGGVLSVERSLELCVPGFPLPIPVEPFSEVVYRLEAGAVDVAGDTVVGSLGVAPARFLQSGGAHRTAGSLRIEGAQSRYEISGGGLSVGSLDVSVGAFNVGGVFAIGAADARVTVDTRVTLGRLAEVEAVAGARLRLETGDVEILGADATLLAGLEQVTLVVAGGSPGELGAWSTLEAAGQDLGDTRDAFEDNFAWAGLAVGDPQATGRLRLVDAAENLPGADAVYVDTLVVEAGSVLDLGGLNLYFRRAEIRGDVLASGGALIAVPEPLSIMVVAVCGVAPLLRGRRVGRAGG